VRPIRLELRGFTAFREQTVIEFEGRRLFAVTGPTGAGKSSLLDAMTWALYGQVPRVGKSTRQLVSHGVSSMQVRFDFATRDEIYRVVRKAPAVTGTRLEQQQADGSWRHLADRSRDVTREVTRLLGMDFTTFTRTVLLPQGEFDAFLKGEQSERRAILTKLLGLGVYDDARKIASDRAKRARERSSTIEAQLAQLNLASPERIAELEAEHTGAQARLCELNERREALQGLGDLARTERDATKAEQDAATTANAAREAQATAERALVTASKAVVEAERWCGALSRERVELQYDAQAHQALRGQIERLKLREAAERDLAEACRALEAATTEHASAVKAATEAAQALAAAEVSTAAATERLQTASGELSEAAGGACLALADLEARAQAALATQHAATAQRKALAERLPVLEAAVRRLEERARTHETAANELKRVGSDGQRAEQAAGAAERTHAAAAAQLEAARATLTEARHADLAATLRVELKPGDPCPVCGDPITQIPFDLSGNGLNEAQAAVAKAERQLERDRQAAVEAKTAAAAAVARTEGATTTLTSAEALLAAIDQELATLETSRDALPAALQRCRGEHTAAEEREAAATLAASGLSSDLETLRLALAAVPDEVAPAEVSEPNGSIEPLTASIEGWRLARDTAAVVQVEQQQARAQHSKFEQAIAAAQARAESASEGVTHAERRLAEHGEEPAGPEATALREALEVAEHASKRAEELDTAITTARAAIAAAIATRTATEAEGTRTSEAVVGAAQQHEAARTCAANEALALASEWHDAIGVESQPGFDALRQLMRAHEADQQTAAIKAGVLGEQIAQSKREIVEADRMRGEVASDRAIAELNGALAHELQGDRFVGYVQREAMQLLAADASYRLDGFTRGRYELATEDNEFVVVDRLNGDERRSVKTLSGGETFLASLALALSLSEHLPQLADLGGAISLESLFLDEGFGALDSDSLDLAVQGLETIAGGRRMIGVISHVEEMAERLPERIEVVKQGNSSTVRG
jgi:exonuclease SbcC